MQGPVHKSLSAVPLYMRLVSGPVVDKSGIIVLCCRICNFWYPSDNHAGHTSRTIMHQQTSRSCLLDCLGVFEFLYPWYLTACGWIIRANDDIEPWLWDRPLHDYYDMHFRNGGPSWRFAFSLLYLFDRWFLHRPSEHILDIPGSFYSREQLLDDKPPVYALSIVWWTLNTSLNCPNHQLLYHSPLRVTEKT